MHHRLNLNNNNGLLYISKTLIDDDFQTNLHAHQNLEILLIIDGKGKIYTTNKVIDVKKGSVLIINPNCKHYEKGIGLSFYALGINKTNIYLKEVFTKKIISLSLNENNFSDYNNIYSLIYNEALQKKNNYQNIINNLTDVILDLLCRNNYIITNNISNESDLVSSIKNIIDNYYYQDIKLDDIAHRLSESKSTICHEFKRITNMTIIEYKISCQLEEACNLLKISDMNISEIAAFVGFNSVSYFNKLFKKHYNASPKEYKNIRKNS